MKKHILNRLGLGIALFICVVFLCQPVICQNAIARGGSGKTLKLMTYNLKFASPDYKPSWEIRREMQVELIRKYNPDIIGTQEGLKEQIDWLLLTVQRKAEKARTRRITGDIGKIQRSFMFLIPITLTGVSIRWPG